MQGYNIAIIMTMCSPQVRKKKIAGMHVYMATMVTLAIESAIKTAYIILLF